MYVHGVKILKPVLKRSKMADDAAFFKMQIFASTTMRLWNDNRCDKRMLEKKFENSILYPMPVCIGPVECCSRYGI